jgi:hypothetical protein
VTVTVAEEDLRHRALIDEALPCCEVGHEGAEEAARHAWTLTRAIVRKTQTA